MPTTKDELATMRLSVVCFMDVLGSQALMESDEAQDHLVALQQALHLAAEELAYSNDGSSARKVLWFTDNIVLVWEIKDLESIGESELGGLFLDASRVTLRMAVHGFFVRGAITVGLVYAEPLFAFGPALVEAVKLEHTLAVHPRTILSKDAFALATAHTSFYAEPTQSPQASELIVDRYGVASLNYLVMTEEQDDEQARLELLERHRDQIAKALASAYNPRVRDKLLWLSRYHNHYCRVALPSAVDLTIAPDALDDQLRGFGSTLI